MSDTCDWSTDVGVASGGNTSPVTYDVSFLDLLRELRFMVYSNITPGRSSQDYYELLLNYREILSESYQELLKVFDQHYRAYKEEWVKTHRISIAMAPISTLGHATVSFTDLKVLRYNGIPWETLDVPLSKLPLNRVALVLPDREQILDDNIGQLETFSSMLNCKLNIHPIPAGAPVLRIVTLSWGSKVTGWRKDQLLYSMERSLNWLKKWSVK